MADPAWFVEKAVDGVAPAFTLKNENKIYEEQTPFQHIAVYETTEFGYLFVFDDLIMLSTRDNFLYHEMISHPALLTHPNPKNVVIIGGGDCGTLREVLKHPSVESVHQIEIDERVTRITEKFFPELCEANDDPRATLLFEDGIKWMAEAADNSADIIIVDSTDPIGPAEGLFQAPFCHDCLRVLRDTGILVQQSESPMIHSRIIKAMYDCLDQTGFQHKELLSFPQPSYPPGWWSVTLASLKTDLHQFREWPELATQYYNADIHRAAWAKPNFVREFLK